MSDSIKAGSRVIAVLAVAAFCLLDVVFSQPESADEDVKVTMSVNMLNKLVTGKDRDKQLIVAWKNKKGETEFIDVNGVEPNEDNVELGTKENPVAKGGGGKP